MIEVALIERAAGLHEVDKIGVPDAMILKSGKPPEEFEVVKAHTSIGARLLSGSRAPHLRLAEEIAWAHHERWEVTGHAGMSGQGIPLSGQIAAVADVFCPDTGSPPQECPVRGGGAVRDRQPAGTAIRSAGGRRLPEGARGGERPSPGAMSCPRPIGGNLPVLGRLCMARERKSRGWTAVIARTQRLRTRVLSRRGLRTYLLRGPVRE
jgi:hypothetical protein